jgi:hypothetical protein
MFGGIDQAENRSLLRIKRVVLLSEKELIFLKNVMYITLILFMQTNKLQPSNSHMELPGKNYGCTRWNNLMS